MSDNPSQSPLFDAQGNLRRELFEPPAWQLLESTLRWVRMIDRQLFLPIDIIVVLLQQREPSTHRTIARLVRGSDDSEGLTEQLGALARRIDRKPQGPASLNLGSFSLGFSGLLQDAFEWATEASRPQVSFRDIVRVARWRAEYQESASVRWALRQLVQPGSERIFDSSGTLIEPLFSTALVERLADSARLSARCGLPFLGTPHLLAALCNDPSTHLWKASESAGVDPLRVRDELMRIVGPRHPELQPFPLNRRTLTPRVVRILMAAMDNADVSNRIVDEACVLEAVLVDGGSSLEILRALGVEGRLRDRLDSHRSQARAERKPAQKRVSGGIPFPKAGLQLANESERPPMLESVGRDLTSEARAGILPPVLGREEELQHVINVLLRTEQRNPLLTGEPGVGKTAIAVALAQAIVEERVPATLKDMRVIEINGASLLGGTSYRGELEERINRILEEAESNTILFMDEAHAIFAPAGTGGRPAEVPNHFKAALASGKISVIAATTDSEYQLWIEQDPALKRRFERISVGELSTVMTRRILQDRARQWSALYDVDIPDEAIDAAIELSTRFIPEQSQPDKAKKLLMDAAITCAAPTSAREPDRPRPSLRRAGVAEVLSRKTGIPVQRVLRNRSTWWKGMNERLIARAPRHAKIAEQLSEHLLSHRVSAIRKDGPQGVFVFAGAPSKSKEILAKALAEELYGTQRSFTKLDMSDFQDAHSISRLIGSPPGYVGYQDEDALVTPLRRRPAQVVFMTDFHLAHPQIQDRIFRMLDDGAISDMRGMRADCRHATFILCVDIEQERRDIGFGKERSSFDSLKALSPTLASRISKRDIPIFSFEAEPLDAASLGTELRRVFDRVREEMIQGYGIEPRFSQPLVESLEAELLRDNLSEKLESFVDERLVRPMIAGMIRGESFVEGVELIEIPGDPEIWEIPVDEAPTDVEETLEVEFAHSVGADEHGSNAGNGKKR